MSKIYVVSRCKYPNDYDETFEPYKAFKNLVTAELYVAGKKDGAAYSIIPIDYSESDLGVGEEHVYAYYGFGRLTENRERDFENVHVYMSNPKSNTPTYFQRTKKSYYRCKGFVIAKTATEAKKKIIQVLINASTCYEYIETVQDGETVYTELTKNAFLQKYNITAEEFGRHGILPVYECSFSNDNFKKWLTTV